LKCIRKPLHLWRSSWSALGLAAYDYCRFETFRISNFTFYIGGYAALHTSSNIILKLIHDSSLIPRVENMGFGRTTRSKTEKEIVQEQRVVHSDFLFY
jgi:hypothetical protein